MSDYERDRPLQPSIDDPFYARLRSFLVANKGESDRGQVLVAASLVEEMLEEILRSYLTSARSTTKLFDSVNAPLSTLSAKTLLSHSLGLITEQEYTDIELLRKIRNRFAHSVMCSFADQQISAWAGNLKAGMSLLDGLPRGDKARVTDPRQRFGMVAVSLVSSLYNRAHYVARHKLASRDWPT